MNMHLIQDPEVRKFRAKAAIAQTAVLLGVVTGLAAIASATPERRMVTMNCAYEPASTGTLSDATSELASACGTRSPETQAAAGATNAEGTAKYGVPDAASSLDPRAQPEALPPTF